ncbi:MAG: hypothetical protein LUF77_03720, partial [Oscillospiraceae bacterium]|nr:hypothetical protein [Oscillospiraceae bacterium]
LSALFRAAEPHIPRRPNRRRAVFVPVTRPHRTTASASSALRKFPAQGKRAAPAGVPSPAPGIAACNQKKDLHSCCKPAIIYSCFVTVPFGALKTAFAVRRFVNK